MDMCIYLRDTGLRRSSALAVPSPSACPRFPQSIVTGVNRSIPNASGPQCSSLAMGLAYLKNLHNECPDVIMSATLSSVHAYYDVYLDLGQLGLA
jgi:hypothetical protein